MRIANNTKKSDDESPLKNFNKKLETKKKFKRRTKKI